MLFRINKQRKFCNFQNMNETRGYLNNSNKLNKLGKEMYFGMLHLKTKQQKHLEGYCKF